MNKKKKILYGLIFVVVFVCGYIVYSVSVSVLNMDVKDMIGDESVNSLDNFYDIVFKDCSKIEISDIYPDIYADEVHEVLTDSERDEFISLLKDAKFTRSNVCDDKLNYKFVFKDSGGKVLYSLYNEERAYDSDGLLYSLKAYDGEAHDKYINIHDFMFDCLKSHNLEFLNDDGIGRVPGDSYLKMLKCVDSYWKSSTHASSHHDDFSSYHFIIHGFKLDINEINSLNLFSDALFSEELSYTIDVSNGWASSHKETVHFPRDFDYSVMFEGDGVELYGFNVAKDGSVYTDSGYKVENRKFRKLITSLKYNPFTKKTVEGTIDKPVIYLYPEKEQVMDIKLSNPKLITCDYPEYDDGWKVKAKPNGDLYDLKHNKRLYSLYYEARTDNAISLKKDGFVVKGSDVAEFLDEKLGILGLNYKEREEFIIYWLPRLEQNRYVYIRFLSQDEINQNMGLNINPEPDALIRVMMSYKGLDKPINVDEQKLKPVKRQGFTVVEWGGTEIE